MAMRKGVEKLREKIWGKSIDPIFIRSHAIANINPISPMRLYKTACRAAVPALLRA